jgi:hypothetical protein
MLAPFQMTDLEKQPFRVAGKAREIVDGLKDVLTGAVALHDAHKQMHHLAMSHGEWWSFKVDKPEPRAQGEGCVVEARINERWTLYVSSRRGLHPDAESLVKWAARLLDDFLPASDSDDDTLLPPVGGGGSGGSAEIGIPVWWARKTRA